MMFYVAFFSRCYWMIGAVLGGMIGQILPFDMEGIDFCMTAVFVVGVSYKSKHHTFLSIVLGTAVYMILLRIF